MTDPFDKYNQSTYTDDTAERESLERIHHRLDKLVADKSAGKSGHLFKIITVVAAAAVILLLIVVKPFNNNNQQLAEAYFSPYPNYVLLTERGEVSDMDATRTDAYKAYDLGNYQEAIRSFEALSSEASGEDKFYQAQALQANGKWKASLSMLLGIEQIKSEYQDGLRWHTALARLANGDVEVARALLIPLMTERTEFSSAARQIVDQL